MAFVVKKKLSLDFLGDGWKDAYLEFSGLTFKESRGFTSQKFDEKNPDSDENLNFVINLLKEHFLTGKGYDGTDLIDIAKDDIEDLPPEAISKAVEALVGGPDPKSTAI
jgi:hypothetical protein